MSNQFEEMTYAVVPHEDRWAVELQDGVFKNFKFVIENLRLTYRDEDDNLKLVEEDTEIDEMDVFLDFEYDVVSVPQVYEPQEGDQQAFETVTRNIVFDVLTNHHELYDLKA